MRPLSRSLLLSCLSPLVFGGVVLGKDPPFDVTNAGYVSQVLRAGGDEFWYLERVGEKAFPAYEEILSDPKAHPDAVGRAFYLLIAIEADRRRFSKYAVLHLTDADSGNRNNAVRFLGDVGSPADASPVVALLTDKDSLIAGVAASVLADIGGPNEVVAMEVWLRGVGNPEHPDIRKGVQYHLARLKKRLEEDKDPKKRAAKIQECWKELRVTEYRYPKLNRAVWILTAFGNETVAFLRDCVHPVPAETQKRLDQLLADLDCDSFERREAATRELSRSVVAEATLEKELVHSPSPEKKRRLETIIEDMPNWKAKRPELLRQLRAVWVLQQIGTPEAKALLEKVAAGAPSARLTQKAKDALQSLKRPQKR